MSASSATCAVSGPYRQHLEAVAQRQTNALIHADGRLYWQHSSLQVVNIVNPRQHKEIILVRPTML